MSERIPLRSAEALRRILQSFSLDLHTAIPGIVRSYDPTTQTADIEPAIRRVLPAANEDDDADETEALPILPSVPIVWPRAGGFFLHFPISPGDSVLVVFSEVDTNAWRASGDLSDPGVPTRHGLSGAVAIPGLYPRGNPCGDADGTHGRVGREGGPFVEFRPAEIHLGGSKSLAEAANLDKHLEAIANSFGSLMTFLDANVTPGYIPDYGPVGKFANDLAFPIPTTITKGD